MTQYDDIAGVPLEDNAQPATKSLQTAMDHVIDKAEAFVSSMSTRASATAGKLGDEAKINLRQASTKTQQMLDDIRPFLRNRTYVSLGVAAVAGVVIGLVVGGSKPTRVARREA